VTISNPQEGDILTYIGSPTGPAWINAQP